MVNEFRIIVGGKTAPPDLSADVLERRLVGKTHGEASRTVIAARLKKKLRKMDAAQLQVVEIVVAAICRGAA